MGNSFENLQSELSSQLANAAVAYPKMGLAGFHSAAKSSWENHQAAVGNLSTAVELLLKTVDRPRRYRSGNTAATFGDLRM